VHPVLQFDFDGGFLYSDYQPRQHISFHVLAGGTIMAEWRKHPRLEFGIKVTNQETSAVSTMSDISMVGCFVKEAG
jgi:hypothetical protein